MISERLKQLRLARGLSLDDLALALGGAVTKQALSKYEQGKDTPSIAILDKLAIVLGVSRTRLWEVAEIRVDFIAYRKKAALPVKEQTRIENQVALLLEERVRLHRRIQLPLENPIRVQSLLADTLVQAEDAADTIRKEWQLGKDPIASVTNVLEEHNVHVLEIDADERFDGISLVAYDTEAKNPSPVSAAVVTRQGIVGDRQRFCLAHELGHLVLQKGETDVEKAAHRFSSAFLAPAETIKKEVGAQRARIEWQELLLLKSHFGMSVQALLYRMKDLGIITQSHYEDWFVRLSMYGYKRVEPQPLPQEESQWLRKNVLRALSEGLISDREAEELLRERVAKERPLSLVDRSAILRLSQEERNRLLSAQAEQMLSYYAEDDEWKELSGGDFVEY